MKAELESLLEALAIGVKVPAEAMRAVVVPPAEQAGGLIADTLMARRLARLPALTAGVRLAWKARGVTPTALPDTFAAAWVQSATLEDEPELQTRWAALLANAADPTTQGRLDIAFVEILRQLSADEARLLDWLKSTEDQKARAAPDPGGHVHALSRVSEGFRGVVRAEALARFPQFDGDSMDQVSVNLERLGLATTGHFLASTRIGRSHTEERVYGAAFSLTPLGHAFVRACRFLPTDGPTAL